MEVEAPFDGVLLGAARPREGDTVAVGAVDRHAVEPGGDAEPALAAVAMRDAAGDGPGAAAPAPATASAPVAAAAPRSDAPRPSFLAVEHGELARTPARLARPGLAQPRGGRARRSTTSTLAGAVRPRARSPARGGDRAAHGGRRPRSRRSWCSASVPVAAGVAASTAPARRGTGATLTDVIARGARRRGGREVPARNAWLVDDEVLEFERVGVALAVDTPDGVVAPVIREAEALGLPRARRRRAELVARARAQRARRRAS